MDGRELGGSGRIRLSRSETRHPERVGTRILTVEDDERIRTSVKMALEDEGWDVVEAESGEQAVESFASQPTVAPMRVAPSP